MLGRAQLIGLVAALEKAFCLAGEHALPGFQVHGEQSNPTRCRSARSDITS